MLIIRKEKEYKYIPVSERGQKDPFTVYIKPLGVRQMAKLEDNYVVIKEGDGVSLQQGAYNTKALKNGIDRWENLKDEDGKEYFVEKNGKGEVLDSSLDLLPPTILAEIANVIISVSKFPEDADTFLGNDKKTKKNATAK